MKERMSLQDSVTTSYVRWRLPLLVSAVLLSRRDEVLLISDGGTLVRTRAAEISVVWMPITPWVPRPLRGYSARRVRLP